MPPLPPSFRRCNHHRREGVNVMRRPRPLHLLRSRPDLLPVGGVADPPTTIRVHGNRFPPLLVLLPPPSSLPCMPSPPPITRLSHLLLPSKRPLRPLLSLPRGCSLLLNPITPSPAPTSASPSRPCLSRLRCPLRRRRPPPTPPTPSLSTLVDC